EEDQDGQEDGQDGQETRQTRQGETRRREEGAPAGEARREGARREGTAREADAGNERRTGTGFSRKCSDFSQSAAHAEGERGEATLIGPTVPAAARHGEVRRAARAP